jgi:glycosyltransferase involved in cell wall biosynthesis
VRIALIITELEPGGAERCLVNLASFLARRGHVVEVFALGRTPSQSLGLSVQTREMTQQLDEAGIPWQVGPAVGWTTLPKTVRWLRGQLLRVKPDVIQSMLFHADVVTALANRYMGMPHCGGIRVGKQAWWRGKLQRWASHYMCRVICVSQQVAEECRIRNIINPEKLMVIPNGITLESDAWEQPKLTPPRPSSSQPEGLRRLFPNELPPFFIFAGRLSDQKGIQPLIEFMPALLERLSEFHFVILGDGQLRKKLDARLSLLPCADRIHLMGWQPNAERWMPFARALLLPSQHEGMPNVLLEAMKSAIPVVAFDVEGVDELLGHSPQQVVPKGNFDLMLQKAEHLASNVTLANELGTANQMRAYQHFQLDQVLTQYERLYLEIS